MKEINLSVTIDEANLILEGLGNLPFAKVYALIAKMQDQAERQCNGDDADVREPGAEAGPPEAKE